MTRDDYQYYAMRAQQEDEAALGASCDAARERHQELADAYRLRCELIRGLFPTDQSDSAPPDQPTSRREPIVTASRSVLAASPATAVRPFCRA